MKTLDFILFYGAALLPSLASTLAFAVWLPGQLQKWKVKLLSSAMISTTVFVLSLFYYGNMYLLDIEDLVNDPLWIP